MKIGSIGTSPDMETLSPAKKGGESGSPSSSFAQLVSGMISEVDATQKAADQAIRSLATGESRNLHEVMIAVEKSSVSFQFLAQVRTKVVEAYQEIMRMPV